jgi:hypothetical protein
MRNSFVVVGLTLATVFALSSNVFACGESVFRAGKGVHYRAFTAPIPGTVLVYARNDEERAVADGLRQAGHDVYVVASDDELASEMQSHQFDVVVAPFSVRVAVETTSLQSSSQPQLIPVVDAKSADMRLAKAEFDDVVVANDDIRKYLKAIHRSLKERA